MGPSIGLDESLGLRRSFVCFWYILILLLVCVLFSGFSALFEMLNCSSFVEKIDLACRMPFLFHVYFEFECLRINQSLAAFPLILYWFDHIGLLGLYLKICNVRIVIIFLWFLKILNLQILISKIKKVGSLMAFLCIQILLVRSIRVDNLIYKFFRLF